MKWMQINYYNVSFYLAMEDETDIVKFSYFHKRIERGERLYMRDIYSWCISQGIFVRTKFQYLKRLPLRANLWNFYSYIRTRREFERTADSS